MNVLRKIKNEIKDNSGSSIIEAAVVFPVAVLITAGIVSAGLTMENHVKEDALVHRDEAVKALKSRIISCENELRGLWLFE